MTKNLVLVLWKVNSIEINSLTFVNNGKTDFSKIYENSENLKENIEILFNKDFLDHAYTRAYDIDADFEFYWSKNKMNWHFIDLNNDKINELLFLSNPSGKPDLYSLTELYVKKNNRFKLIYSESGAIYAYKIHKNTKEIVLFHHKFPCCSSKSNNIDMIRVINGKIKLRKEEMTKVYPSLLIASRLLGWRAKMPFDKGILKTISFYN